ncbi:hypothetical protein [Nocardiopsis sp. CC223A]|nr:hypothetical protein [Nocardiopsis sp. CC223A]
MTSAVPEGVPRGASGAAGDTGVRDLYLVCDGPAAAVATVTLE